MAPVPPRKRISWRIAVGTGSRISAPMAVENSRPPGRFLPTAAVLEPASGEPGLRGLRVAIKWSRNGWLQSRQRDGLPQDDALEKFRVQCP